MDEKYNQGEDSVGMTDNQSRRFEELIRENETLRCKLHKADAKGMTDLQFNEYMKVCAERDALREENQALRGNRTVCGSEGMTEYQLKTILSMLYQTVKASFEASKSPEEILMVLETLI